MIEMIKARTPYHTVRYSKGLNNINNDVPTYIHCGFENDEIPDTLPGCFGSYTSDLYSKCVVCEVRNPCARTNEGD